MEVKGDNQVQFNFFAWIREGVRRSVLLGVNDAVESIGAPEDENAWKAQLTRMLENGSTREAPALAARKSKRLGRSLKDFAADSKGQS